jgi:Fe-S cluster assembly protein SufD
MEEIVVSQNQDFIFPVIWTGKERELTYSIRLTKPGAKITFLALLLGKNEETLDIKTIVSHEAKDTKSEVIIKSALNDYSYVNFEGLVKINHGAKGTNAWLAAHILLLSKTARGRAIPSLEITENDIKAGHATTVGRVNELELFYLMSRGLSEKSAKQLIVQGFLHSILDRFPQKNQTIALKQLQTYGQEYL